MRQENNSTDFIFHTNTESGKTDDISANPEVNLGFINSYGEWASISGTASIITDRSKVHKFYSPELKAWIGDLGDGKHDGGPDDPRIAVIEVKSKSAQYAISRRTVIGGAIELAKGVITGEAPQVNKLRHISESELQQGMLRKWCLCASLTNHSPCFLNALDSLERNLRQEV